MPLRVTPEQYAEKQARRLKGAIQDVQAGIERVNVAPGQTAADRVQKWQQRVQESSAKWQRNTRAVSLEDWRQAAIQKGIPRISGGIDAAQPKVVAMAARLLPAVEAARNKARAMPDLTLQDSIARMTTFVTEMAKFSK